MRPIRLLVLFLCAVGGCAPTRSSQVSNPNVVAPACGNGAPQSPGANGATQPPGAGGATQAPNPNTAQPPDGACVTPTPPVQKPLWKRLLPWDFDEDDKPKTQKQIDDDFKWRNNG